MKKHLNRYSNIFSLLGNYVSHHCLFIVKVIYCSIKKGILSWKFRLNFARLHKGSFDYLINVMPPYLVCSKTYRSDYLTIVNGIWFYVIYNVIPIEFRCFYLTWNCAATLFTVVYIIVKGFKPSSRTKMRGSTR